MSPNDNEQAPVWWQGEITLDLPLALHWELALSMENSTLIEFTLDGKL